MSWLDLNWKDIILWIDFTIIHIYETLSIETNLSLLQIILIICFSVVSIKLP